MPLHTPPDTDEWNRHRNLKTPLVPNFREVVCPWLSTVSFDQFEEYDVSVWLLQPAFQVTVDPCVTVTDFGEKKLHFAVTSVEAEAGVICAVTAAATSAPTTNLRTTVRPSSHSRARLPVYGRGCPMDCKERLIGGKTRV